MPFCHIAAFGFSIFLISISTKSTKSPILIFSKVDIPQNMESIGRLESIPKPLGSVI
jgi:hypothetical protein